MPPEFVVDYELMQKRFHSLLEKIKHLENSISGSTLVSLNMSNHSVQGKLSKNNIIKLEDNYFVEKQNNEKTEISPKMIGEQEKDLTDINIKFTKQNQSRIISPINRKNTKQTLKEGLLSEKYFQDQDISSQNDFKNIFPSKFKYTIFLILILLLGLIFLIP
jgi:DNA-binding protein Fis